MSGIYHSQTDYTKTTSSISAALCCGEKNEGPQASVGIVKSCRTKPSNQEVLHSGDHTFLLTNSFSEFETVISSSGFFETQTNHHLWAGLDSDINTNHGLA